jgi:hypothetical protein
MHGARREALVDLGMCSGHLTVLLYTSSPKTRSSAAKALVRISDSELIAVLSR